MKVFLKIFGIAFGCFILAMGAGLLAYSKFYQATEEIVVSEEIENNEEAENAEQEDEDAGLTELEKLIKYSKRINVLLLGMEGPRTDTILFASFDPESKDVDLISIPRDTYFHRKGYNHADQKKLNAVYGAGGIDGTTAAVGHILGGVPVHHYVKVTYKGVERIVDALGGVKVNVPMNMEYDDPYDNPPLHIRIQKGTQVLNGKEAVHFLRFRKNNNGGGYPDGDLGRMKAQQQFMKAAFDKALGFRLPVVANTVFKQVKTSMDLSDMLGIATEAVGITKGNLNTYSLPGRATEKGVSYFLHDIEQTEQMMIDIYSGVQQ